jgi:transcriptional regulator with XRE-family HTH domain
VDTFGWGSLARDPRTPRGVKAWREHYGWSQHKLAERAGCATTSINAIETGKRPARTDTLRRIVDALLIEPQLLHEMPDSPAVAQSQIEQSRNDIAMALDTLSHEIEDGRWREGYEDEDNAFAAMVDYWFDTDSAPPVFAADIANFADTVESLINQRYDERRRARENDV